MLNVNVNVDDHGVGFFVQTTRQTPANEASECTRAEARGRGGRPCWLAFFFGLDCSGLMGRSIDAVIKTSHTHTPLMKQDDERRASLEPMMALAMHRRFHLGDALPVRVHASIG